jgi:aquaporin Z
MDERSGRAEPGQLGEAEKLVEAALGGLVRALEDFDDPSQEWRRLCAELFGTFLLVLAAAGGPMMGQVFPDMVGTAAAVVAPGLMVLVVILFMGKVSGAHLNPAVSIAFSLRGDFPWRRVPGYLVVQLAGATLAAWFLQAVVHVSATHGATYPAAGYSAGDAFAMETVLTLGLVSVVLGTASGAQNLGPIAAFGVGAYIALAGLWAGAVLAVGVAFILRGRGGGRSGSAAAQGALFTRPKRPDQR